MPHTKKSKQGGRRRGAGRPLLGPEPREILAIRLPASLIERARWLGEGNVSLGVCRALDTAPDWARKLE